MNMRSYRRLLGLSVLLLLTTACARHPSVSASGPVFQVQVAPVRSRLLTPDVTVPGRVTRRHNALLASRRGGFITASPAKAGRHVQKGALLVVVGQASAEAVLSQARDRRIAAQADLTEARAQDRRYHVLYREGVVSTHEYETVHRRYLIARAGEEAAAAGWAAARANLAYARIRAPFAGLVAERFLHRGGFAAPGAPLVRLVGGAAEIRTAVANRIYRVIRIGETVTVSVSGRTYQARITRMVDAANPSTGTHEIRLAFPAAGPRPADGAFAAVAFPVRPAPALVIPKAALVRRAGQAGVFVVTRGDLAFFQPVRAIPSPRGRRVVAAAGLVAGDRVVVNPPAGLGNGSRIVPNPAHA